jgi:hypothetical protein
LIVDDRLVLSFLATVFGILDGNTSLGGIAVIIRIVSEIPNLNNAKLCSFIYLKQFLSISVNSAKEEENIQGLRHAMTVLYRNRQSLYGAAVTSDCSTICQLLGPIACLPQKIVDGHPRRVPIHWSFQIFQNETLLIALFFYSYFRSLGKQPS